MLRELGRCMPNGELVTEGTRLRSAGHDATEARGVHGQTHALAIPGHAREVAAVLAWCYRHDVALVARGGGTGLAGGAVPDGGIVVSLEGLDQLRGIEPHLWRMQAESGVRTAHVHRLARENGLMFPPDPGASEQSTLGGNIATNAGGPHAFKYGVTGNWVMGLEVALPPGEIIKVGGPVTKDVAGFDLLNLLIGSEGTLGIVTSAWLRLMPAPEARAVTFAFYGSVDAGCRAVATVRASGIQASALEYLDRGALQASVGSLPFDAPDSPTFAVLAEVDGSPEEVRRVSAELVEALAENALAEPANATERGEIDALWSWRDGVSIAVTTQRGGKVSEDIVVPPERLAEAVVATAEIGRNRDLPACSWGHAGDGNVHASFLVALDDPDQLERAEAAAGDVFDLAIRLGGSISGEHGIGRLKTAWVEQALGPRIVGIQDQVKRAFDPKMLLNPGKKIGSSTDGDD